MGRWLRFAGILAAIGFALPAADLVQSPSAGAESGTESHALQPFPPAPPSLPSRAVSAIESFRQLLNMTDAEREIALARKSAQQQAIIRRELRAFEGLNAQARENRLRLLAMRLIMDPLIALSPLDRPPALAGLAPSQRAFVTGQLRAWDALPEEQRSRLLATHGGWIPLPTFEVLPPSPPAFTEPPAPPAPGFRSRVEMDLDRWAALGEQAQTNATRALIRLFGLSAKDQQAVLSRLEPHRRNLVERMLASFGRMEAESRSRAVAAFLRFAAMSPEDRTNFWRNADRWESLTSEERRAWRALTAHLPPLPPGLGPAPALPPAPPNASSSALRTNAQAAR